MGCMNLSPSASTTHRPPLPKPLGQSESGVVPTSGDMDFLTVPIPYGSPTIITSDALNAINCIFYKPLKLLICVVCEIALQPKTIRRHHRGTAHMDPALVSQANIDNLVKELGVREDDVLDAVSTPCPAIPGIPFRRSGLHCAFPTCGHARVSRKNMAEHVRVDHLSTIKQWEPQTHAVQAIFKSNSKYYPVNPPTETEVPEAPPDLNQLLETKYMNIVSQLDSKMNSSILNNSAHLPPFLAKYR
jgi:hypothetical protein